MSREEIVRDPAILIAAKLPNPGQRIADGPGASRSEQR
jgi:hypothetical protein